MQISENIVTGNCLSKTSCHQLNKQLKLWPFWFQSVYQLQACATAATAICFMILCMNEFTCFMVRAWFHLSGYMNSHNIRTENGNCKSCHLFLWDRKCTGQGKMWVTICADCRKIWRCVGVAAAISREVSEHMHGKYCTLSWSSTQTAVRKLHLPPYNITAVQELKGPDKLLHVASVFAWGIWNKHA
jgi:hypothetical protein